MTTDRDYYEILGIGRAATDDDIKRAYRQMAMKYHPDRNPDDDTAEEKFKEATEAYEVLKDSQTRQVYDTYGHAGLKGSQGGRGFGFDSFGMADALRAFMRDFGNFGSFGGLDDLFGFGQGGSRGPRVFKGEDLRLTLKVTLEEIAEGVEKSLKVKVHGSCSECGGSGSAKGSSKSVCPQCSGRGEVRKVSRSMFGQFVRVQPCDYCNGMGQVITTPCSKCAGDGRESVDKNISVKIPAGVAEGNYITLRGSGNAGPQGGPHGDLIVFIKEIDHDKFERHGDDIVLDVPISFAQAALGSKIEIPTLNGNTTLDIPSGTQSGRLFRLRNKGIRHLRTAGRGDQLVQVLVWTPTKLDKTATQLFERLSSLEGIAPPKSSKSFFKRLKDSLGV
ncbi:MAG: molecular chaperone DnaJ [candidate division Zixibacteria bacterium]|nr:molecular chaperone DnaJ [candidate division Zixibacteria bacterium]MBU1469939.1 molecular chaperone DnaJ [candidate division Zixibacteria bacterium]MBU2626958.1 molecular chaperone DnaJ [candidate division Zixibacteria bacterium]